MPMKKQLKLLELLANSERLNKLQQRKLEIPQKDNDLFIALIARLCTIVNPEVDEDESYELIEDFLKTEALTVQSIHKLGLLVRTTRLNESIHTVH